MSVVHSIPLVSFFVSGGSIVIPCFISDIGNLCLLSLLVLLFRSVGSQNEHALPTLRWAMCWFNALPSLS